MKHFPMASLMYPSKECSFISNFLRLSFYLRTLIELLNEVSLAAQEEVLHGEEMLLEMELLVEDSHQNRADFLMGLG